MDLDALLTGYDWLHLSGITPALAPNCRQLVLDMLKVAHKKGMTVSFDGNFRSTLWTWEEARDFCTECLPYVNILLGIEPYHLWKDENDHSPPVPRPPRALCPFRLREQPEGIHVVRGPHL